MGMWLESSEPDRVIARSERPFLVKVQEIHDSWAETRQTIDARRDRGRHGQATMLGYVFNWTAEAALDLARVYGDLIELTPEPDLAAAEPGFVLHVGPVHTMHVDLVPHPRSPSEWLVRIRLSYPDEHSWVTVHWGRRHDNWTRERLEEVILSLLSAFERSRLPSPRR
jgi:hypothetical protein